ncbi:MAG: PilC/PilY family type IV pilus protein, partial [Pseudomonadota bacterium]
MNHLTIKKAKLLTASLAATLATGTVFAEPGTLSESPLFLSDAVEPNVIMALDDSGSMDFETLLPTNDASLWWNTADQSFIGRDINDNPAPGVLNFNRNGGNNANWRKYTQLFPNGYANGNASLGGANGRFPVPPIVEFGYVRSSFYNPGYYDHTITYEPWVDTGLRTFNDSNPTNAPWDPITNATTFTIDLTQDFFRDTDDGWRFYTVPGMRDGDGNPTVTAMYDAYRYFLPTYFVPDSTLTLSAGGIPIDCAAPNPANYGFFYLNATALTGTADAVGPDGQCLRRVEIRPTTPSFPSGRTYAEEIQNFANYFTYYRKRHHALRAGVTQALDSIGAGVRVGTFRFNNRQPVTMRSLTTDYDDVLDDIFTSRGNGGTPTRDSLIYAGEQFRRTDANAPITHACQKNYGIVFTDGFATLTNNAVNNVDGTAGVPFADNVDDTLGDIAMEYYNNLNMTGFASGQVPTPIACAAGTDPTLDCNSDLHMTTYGVTLNSTGTIFNVTHFDVADAHANPPTWPDPLPTRSPQMVDDLYHAAVNGRGEMLNARTPLDIATQMTEVLKAVVETEGTAAAVTFNTGLLSSDSLVYQAKLDSEEWSGFVTASALDPVTGAVATTPSWDAADLIPLENNRQISTFDPTTGGIPFRNLASLTANQAADMATDLPPTMTAQDMVDYLRGARTNESETLFRQRAARTVLGDIVHSSPVLVGAPRSGWPNAAPFPTGTDAYGNFETAQASRREAVYVGANDGMLHGIWADVGQSDSGVEFMGYIPNALFSSVSGEGLHELAQQDYTHKYFVDLTPTVTDAYVRTTASGSPDWATVLVGGLRGGGRGMFALDVTDPTVMSESDAGDFVMWEFTDADDADLGFAFSEPTISLMNNGQWAAVFGNGYNSTGSTNAYLFIVFLEGGLDRTWTLGSDYIKIELPGAANGLGTPQLADLDGNGTPDRAYAGDLYGNMWA